MAKTELHLMSFCKLCGTEYMQSKSNQSFCSKNCYLKSWQKINRTGYHVQRKCNLCSKLYDSRSSRNIYCSKKCRDLSDSQKKKIINGVGKGWSKGKQYVPRLKCKVCSNDFYAPPALIKRGGGIFCSRKCRGINMTLNPETLPTKGGRSFRHVISGKRNDLGEIHFRSSWEANYARILNLLIDNCEIKKWEFESQAFIFKGIGGYLPDFKVWNKHGQIEFHEVKGYMCERSKEKIALMRSEYPNIKLKLIDKNEYRKLEKIYINIIPNWEKRRS